jgi:hypothetical protein
MVRCLELNRLVLKSLGEPLEIERNCGDHYGCGGGGGDDGDDDDDGSTEAAEQGFEQLSLKLGGQEPIIPPKGMCCGRGCSEKSCFSFLVDFVVQIQYPIQQTIDHFNKSGTDKPKLKSFISSFFGSDGEEGEKESATKKEL